MYSLTMQEEFSAAHYLRGYQGPCQKLHGHTWRLEVTILPAQVNDSDMMMPIDAFKARLMEIVHPLDHGCLNELPAFQNINPTAENLARYIYRKCTRQLQAGRVKQVRVWESDCSSVIYYENETT